jgi:hypothetical protein
MTFCSYLTRSIGIPITYTGLLPTPIENNFGYRYFIFPDIGSSYQNNLIEARLYNKRNI